MRTSIALLSLTLAAAATAVAAVTADTPASSFAAELAVVRDGDIYTIRADGRALRALTRTPWNEYAPAWSPDGQRLAFVSYRHGRGELYVSDAEGRGLRRLTRNRGEDLSPSWSPDGTRIAFVSDRTGAYEVFVMRDDGSGVRRVTRFGRPAYGSYAPAWSPDGRTIVFSTSALTPENPELYSIRPDGKHRRRLTTTIGDAETLGDDSMPSWFGSRIVFTSNRTGEGELWIMRPDGRGQRRFGGLPRRDDFNPRFSPDGTQIVFESRTISADVYVIGANRRGLSLVVRNASEPSWRPQGATKARIVAAARGGITATGYQPRTDRTLVWRGDADSLGLIRSLPKARLAAVAPDGLRIAFLRPTHRGFDLVVTGAGSGAERRLASFDASLPTTGPAFSPNGKLLAVAVDGGIELVAVAAPSARRALVLPGAWRRSAFAALAFSSDGTRLAFSRTFGDGRKGTLGSEIDAIGIDGSAPRTLAVNSSPYDAQLRPVYSPDGARIAFSDGAGALAVVPARGGPVRRLTTPVRDGADSDPVWSPDGRTIAFTRSRIPAPTEAYVIGADGSGLRRLTRTPIPPRGEPRTGSSALAWSPEGSRLLVFRHDRFEALDVASKVGRELFRVGFQYGLGRARWA